MLRKLGLAGVIAVSLALILAACGVEQTPGTAITPGDGTGVIEIPAEPSDPTALINFWRVSAEGVSPDTWLKLDGGWYDIWQACGTVMGAWRIRENAILFGGPDGSSGDCTPDVLPWFTDWQVSWLQNATSWIPSDDGATVTLLSPDGSVLATLHDDGTLPPENPNIWDEMRRVPEVTDQVQTWLADPAPLPAGYSPVTAAQLIGHWAPTPTGPCLPWAGFAADGTWTGSDGANGQAGAWRVSNGAVLATVGAQTQMYCDGLQEVGSWLWNAGRVGYPADCAPDPETSSPTCLVLFDNNATELGRLFAGESGQTPGANQSNETDETEQPPTTAAMCFQLPHGFPLCQEMAAGMTWMSLGGIEANGMPSDYTELEFFPDATFALSVRTYAGDTSSVTNWAGTWTSDGSSTITLDFADAASGLPPITDTNPTVLTVTEFQRYCGDDPNLQTWDALQGPMSLFEPAVC